VIVVDTSALLAILNKEAERDRFLDVLASDDRVMVSAVTLYESMLVAAARRGPDNLSDLAQILETVQAEIVPFDADQARTRLSTCATAKACIQWRGSICATASRTPWRNTSTFPCSSRA
jgi:ribonuclease VapC